MAMKPRNGIVEALLEPLHAGRRQRDAHLDAAGAAPPFSHRHGTGSRHGHDLHLDRPPEPKVHLQIASSLQNEESQPFRMALSMAFCLVLSLRLQKCLRIEKLIVFLNFFSEFENYSCFSILFTNSENV